LLDYRWRRLDAARLAASRAGLAGALFPWQSGSDGREETPAHLFNSRSGRWMPDNSRWQLHVGLAIAYDAWRYYQATGDVVWLRERGAELIVEVARLFAALATHDPVEDRFHLNGVMGPDEYHDGYPDAPGEGLRDNAYTNVLAAWVCGRAVDTLALLAGRDGDELMARLGIDPRETSRWVRMGCRLAVPFHEGIISQFDGYESLAELDWAGYRASFGDLGRLDLILEAEGDSTNRYKVAKQADVLMLVYLLGADGLHTVLAELGYPITDKVLADTVDYHLARTADGSSLSRVVHASVLARQDTSRAWRVFREALAADLDDAQGGTTQEGIHLGAMAGTIDLITRVFAGLQTRADLLAFNPRLPDELSEVRFQVMYRGQSINVTLDHDRLRLVALPDAAYGKVCIEVAGSQFHLGGGQTREVALGRDW
jgi:trehalose/maltose hydrolase-like predicted phosphorylase